MSHGTVRKEDGERETHLGDAWRSEDLSRHEGEIDEGPGLFLRFLSSALFMAGLGAYLLLYLVSPRLAQLHQAFPVLLTYLLSGLLLLIVLLLSLTFLTVLTGRSFFPLLLNAGQREKGLVMLLTPFAVRIGKWFGVSKDRVASSFIKANNAIVIATRRGDAGRSVLLLLPRCIQHSKCKQKVEIDIVNCKDCGLCDIADIVRVCEENGVESYVATGGNLARKLIKEKRPAGVIGVACERELLSGIHDTSGLPVIGIPNLRPEGPCIDTRVNLEKVEEAIRAFIR